MSIYYGVSSQPDPGEAIIDRSIAEKSGVGVGDEVEILGRKFKISGLKVPWSHIHNEAHHIEHTISDEIEDHMRDSLDDPQLCPHGNPLPGFEYIAEEWIPLTDVVPGAQVIIRRIHETAEDNPELMYFLETNNIVPGNQAEVAEVLSFNQTVTLQIGEHRVTVGFQAARNIFVE